MIDQEAIKKLVIARLDIMPENVRLSLGGTETLDKHAMISHVETGDDIGKKIIEMHLHYLRSLKKGEIYEEDVIPDKA